MSEVERNNRKIRVGVVVSDSRDKTVTIEVPSSTAHPRYDKVVRTGRKFHAHDENNDCNIGDTVKVIESRPLSARKRWALVEIIERAK